MLFISHDLPVIRQMCDRVAVMRRGAIVEINDTESLFASPRRDYTRNLIDLMPHLIICHGRVWNWKCSNSKGSFRSNQTRAGGTML